MGPKDGVCERAELIDTSRLRTGGSKVFCPGDRNKVFGKEIGIGVD